MDDMQSRIAARRAEIERERVRVEAATRLAQDNQRAEEEAASDREWAKKERVRKERKEQAASLAKATAAAASRKAIVDREIRAAARKKWTGLEICLVAVPLTTGLFLLPSHPVWGVIVLFLASLIYTGGNATHRDEVLKERPDLVDEKS